MHVGKTPNPETDAPDMPPDRPRPGGLLALRHWPMWMLLGLGRRFVCLPYRLLLGSGALLGVMSHAVLRKRRKRAAQHIAMCFPEQSAEAHKRLVRANFVAYGMGIVERLIAWWWPRRRLLGLLNSIEGLEHLQRARTEGRGVILLATHSTTMEMGGALIRVQHPVDGSYLPDTHPVYDWTQQRARNAEDRLGTTIEASKVREILRRLRAGRTIWYAPDRDFGPKAPHVFAPFFGIPAATVIATSKYARMSDAYVMTLECWRDAGGGYSLRIGAPLDAFPSNDPVMDCTRINAWIESVARRNPEQYRWVHKRFKTQPSQAA